MDKWLDKPDSDGWWWFYSVLTVDYKTLKPYSYGMECCHIIKQNGILTTYNIGDGRFVDISDYQGKWCKAIVPEFKE